MNQERFKKFAPAVVRIGVSIVFLWFGVEQLIDAKNWVGWLPTYSSFIPLQPITIVQLNGIFETVFGLLLISGFYTRIVAIFLSLHMAHIVSVVGYGEIGVRDFGILAGVVSTAFNGPDFISLDEFLKKRIT